MPFLILALFFFSSCSSRTLELDYNIPAAEFGMHPETLGGLGKFELGGNIHIAHDVELGGTTQSSSLFSSSPGEVVIEVNNPTLGADGGALAHGTFGVHEFVDLQVRSVSQSANQVGAKLCLYYNCVVGEKGLKFSLYAFYGYAKEDEAASDFDFFDPDDNSDDFSNVTADIIQRSYSIGFSLGYRENERNIFYFNGSFQSIEVEAPVSIEGGENFSTDARTENWSLLMGARHNKELEERKGTFFFYLEAGYGQLNFWGIQRRRRDGFISSLGIGAYLL